jgi:hypothetical protein
MTVLQYHRLPALAHQRRQITFSFSFSCTKHDRQISSDALLLISTYDTATTHNVDGSNDSLHRAPRIKIDGYIVNKPAPASWLSIRLDL